MGSVDLGTIEVVGRLALIVLKALLEILSAA
jgi:hypothetical protein